MLALRETDNFTLIIPRTPPIIPEYSLILFPTYNGRNYASIIDVYVLTVY